MVQEEESRKQNIILQAFLFATFICFSQESRIVIDSFECENSVLEESSAMKCLSFCADCKISSSFKFYLKSIAQDYCCK